MTIPVVDWTVHSLPAEFKWDRWTSIAYGNSVFVAVILNDDPFNSAASVTYCATSTDAITWTRHLMPVGYSGAPIGGWVSVAFGNGRFVATAIPTQFGYLNYFATSVDGVTWTWTRLPQGYWGQVGYGNGLFVALESQYPCSVAASVDGTTWTKFEMPVWAMQFRQVVYGNGIFVTIGDGAFYPDTPYVEGQIGFPASCTSADGVVWTLHELPAEFYMTSLTYANGIFVAVGAGAATSTDGITWTRHTMPQGAWGSITFGNGVFVATASSDYQNPDGSSHGVGLVALSVDGINWTASVIPALPMFLNQVAFANGIFLLGVGDDLSQSWVQRDPFVAIGVLGQLIPAVKRYLRMNQRDDGAGIARHPRLSGAGTNNPTSRQSGKPRRLGGGSTYQ